MLPRSLSFSTAVSFIALFTLFLSTFSGNKTFAQMRQEPLVVAQEELLTTGIQRTSAHYLMIADSCSVRKDSTCAAKALLAVDDYYLLFAADQTLQTIDSFLHSYTIDAGVAQRIKQRFIKTYHSKKTAAYALFRRLYEEDQTIRAHYNQCKDSISCSQLRLQMRALDSLHAAHLLKYVLKHGWPFPENGGYYAGALALHDHARHDIYLPEVKKALLSGKADPSLLQWLLYYQTNLKGRGSYLKMLDTTRHQRFDVSELLAFHLPQCLPQINQFLQGHCKVKLYLLFESFENSQYASWSDKAHYLGNTDRAGHILAQFANKTRVGCRAHLPENLWAIHWEATPPAKPKIILYITY